MITQKIKKQIVEGMKAKDKMRVGTLKMLSSELHNARIEKGEDLTEEEEIKVLQKEAKKRKDAVEAYKKAGRDELVEKETKELEIISEYLPEEMSDEDLEKIVFEVMGESDAIDIKDMGKVMGLVMKKVGGQVEGGRVSQLVRKLLTK